MAEKIVEMVTFLPPEIRVFFLSMIPITELRVAVPLGLALGIDPVTNYLYCVAGNLVPVLPILLFLNPVLKFLSRFPPLGRLIGRILKSAEEKRQKYEKFETAALVAFVAVPAPGTGAWTGSLLAFLSRMAVPRAFLAVSAGVLIAGLVVTLLSLGAIQLLARNLVYGLVFLAVILVLWFLLGRKRKQ